MFLEAGETLENKLSYLCVAVLIGDLRADKQRKSQHHLLVLPYPLVRALSKDSFYPSSFNINEQVTGSFCFSVETQLPLDTAKW